MTYGAVFVIFADASGSPLWGSWREAPERARTLTENHIYNDSSALTKSLLIAVSQLYPAGLALSVCFADTSPKGRGFAAAAAK